MRIGIDTRPLILRESGGISQLVKGVCERLFESFPEDAFTVFCTPFNRSLLAHEGANVRHVVLSAATYFEDMDRAAAEAGLDVLFRAYPTEDSLRFPRRRQIVLIPDNQHEAYPEFFTAESLRTRRKAFSTALKHAGAIGTISEFSRNALQSFPDTLCRDIFLMPPALQESHRKARMADLGDSEREMIPAGGYFLLPANLWKHKNHRRILEAFALFRQRSHRETALVLTGHAERWPELARRFPDLPVRHLGFVRPEFLRVLLEHASALVFFSLYEGFGIPLLEAFDAGTPVICSDTTSLPDVGGDAVLACDPTDVNAMASLMESVVADEALRAVLVMRGRERLKRYSWDDSAASLRQACRRVAHRADAPIEPLPLGDGELPLVSIVTPSFNQGRFLRRTIDSVLAQTYPKVEYVVIDGGSTDESPDVLRSYGERLLWLSGPDGGQTNAINKGMAITRGAIVGYLNSDDVLLPDAIERAVGYLLWHPDWDMVYGNADYIDEDDRVTGAYATDDYSFERLMESCMVCQPAAFWRRRIAERIGPFDERLNYVMDYDYWLRIDRADGRIHFVPDKLAQSRLHKDAKTLTSRAAIYRECIRICSRHGGRVDTGVFYGYWQHLMHERDGLPSRILRRLPLTHVDIGWLHHRWHHGALYFARELGAFCAGWVLRRLGLDRSRIWQRLSGRETAGAEARARRVTGAFADNWLGPELVIDPAPAVPGEILHIAGTAAVDLTMTVNTGDTEIGRVAAAASERVRFTFAAESIRGKTLTIRFAGSVVDAAKRRVSFLLQDTNIFSEKDIS